jgi:hypothetical protein
VSRELAKEALTIHPWARSAARRLLDRLPASARVRIRANRDVFRGLVELKRNQAMLASRLAVLEDRDEKPAAAAEPPDPNFPPGVRSRLCTQSQLREPWFAEWCAVLGVEPRAHRKLWERAYVAHVLDTMDLLRPGARGLGFGVGREALVALFAGRGCHIVATDLPPTTNDARVWRDSGQYGDGLEGLRQDSLCDPDRFAERVRWRSVDMRAIPDDLRGFDFCWSVCSLEHLGSLEAGSRFVERSLATLVPGGIAVHTTEFNVGSDGETIVTGPTVLYREQDIVSLVARLERAGHQVAALALDRGEGVLDQYVDVPPYSMEPHLRVSCGSFVTTSLALVIRAARP